MGKFAGFSSVQLQRPQKSTFDLSHTRRITMQMGRLTPVLITECVPSDSFRGSSEILVRVAPLLAPIYDQLEMYVHYFFVPNRLLWEDWEEFITGGRLGVGVDPVTAPVPPYVDLGEVLTVIPEFFGKGTLADFLGCPLFLDQDPTAALWVGRHIDIMPFAAYHLCWFEYFRDRNFVSDEGWFMDEDLPMRSGEFASGTIDLTTCFRLRERNYRHDYFTSALPFTQRGEEVLMPLAGTGSVTYFQNSRLFKGPTDVNANPGAIGLLGANGGFTTFQDSGGSPTAAGPLRVENIDEVNFDASSVSINDFRSAYALQVWLERNALGGSRYTESTQAHFGVKPQDSRLQRPEYIGGGRITVKISEVVSTSWSNDGVGEVPLANLAGHGVAYGDTNRFNYFCTEHGFIIGIASLLAPATYQQGLPRMFRRTSFLDYPWPTFAKLGEQPVNDYEIYATPTTMLQDADGEYPLFGYQSRYADWKYMCNTNHGDFKDTLLFWTLTRVFEDTPVLGFTFNRFESSVANRIFAVQDGSDQFWLYVFNKVTVKRPLPYFGIPNTLNF